MPLACFNTKQFLSTAREGNVFRSICLFTLPVWYHVPFRGMMSLPVWSYFTSRGVYSQGGVCCHRGSAPRRCLAPRGGVSTTPNLQYWHRMVATVAVGTHPTGKHSCLKNTSYHCDQIGAELPIDCK